MASATLAEAPLAPYARVKKYLRDGLAAGRWTPGALMPSEAELVADFGVSRMTVNRALRELRAEGSSTARRASAPSPRSCRGSPRP
jgi:GntR family histidine utilization transcriptional repressor